MDVDGDGQPRDVRGGDLAGYAERGYLAAESLGADAQRVDAEKRLFFDGGDVFPGVAAADVARQRLFGEEGAGIKAAADAHAHVDGRAGAGARQAHRVRDRLQNAFRALRGGEHAEPAHVLAAEPLGQKGDAHAIARNELGVQMGGRVVGSVHAGERIADALAEQPVAVSAAYAVVHRFRKGHAREADVLPELDEHYRHARILADGHLFPRGDLLIFQHGAEREFCGAFFAGCRAQERVFAGAGELRARAPCQAVYAVGDRGGFDGSHNRLSPWLRSSVSL